MKKLQIILLCLPIIGFTQTTWTSCDSSFSININSQNSFEVVYSVSGPNLNMNSNFSWIYFNMIGQCIGGSNSVASHIDTLNSLNINNITDSTAIMCLITDSLSSCIVTDTLVYDSLTGWSMTSNQFLALQTYVPDDAFEGFLEANGMGNGISNDDYVTTSNIDTVTILNIMYFLYPSDLTGIEDFTLLEQLDCSQLQLISLDLSQNTALTDLICWGNQLTTLNVSNNSALINLDCQWNQLTSLDVSNNTALEYLNCNGNELASLDVSNNTVLVELHCGDEFSGGNQLANLDVSQNILLTHLSVGDNQLTSLDVSSNTNLISLICNQNWVLSSLDVSNNTLLNYFVCYDNQLSTLDLSNNIALTYLMCQDNQIQGALDLSGCNDLIEFNCGDNQLTSLDVRNGNNTNFMFFRCRGNSSLTCVNVDDTNWSTNNWTVVDLNIDSHHYFSNNCPAAAIQEHTTNKELLKVTDLLGRGTKQTNQPLLYIYESGTVEKRIVIE